MAENGDVLREIVAALLRLAEQLGGAAEPVPYGPHPNNHNDQLCFSCGDMSCVRNWRTFGDAPRDSADIRAFLIGHGLIRGYTCALHGDARMVDRGDYWECIHLVTPQQQCRRRQSMMFPLLDRNSKVEIEQLFRFWMHVASNDALSSIARIVGVHRNTCLRLFDLLGSACLRASAAFTPRFNRCSVDETYFGSRKYNRGKKARRRGYWFVTVTEIERGGGMGATSWTMVKRRDGETLRGVVQRHIVGARTVVVSDEHRGYRRLNECCQHYRVNHSLSFVSPTGHHTNCSESAHALIKRWMRAQTGRFGLNSSTLQKNVAVQCAKVVAGVPSTWSSRMQALLLVIKAHYSTKSLELEEFTSDEDSGDSEEEEEEEDEEEQQAVEEGNDEAGNRKRQREDEEEEETEDDEDDTDSDHDEWDEAPIADRGRDRAVERRDGLRSLEPGGDGILEGWAVYWGIQSLLPRGFACTDPAVYSFAGSRLPRVANGGVLFVPLFYAEHWILCVARPGVYRVEVYDSARAYMRDERAQHFKRLVRVVRRSWGQGVRCVMKATVQQQDETSCGLHTVNNALRLAGVARPPFTRVTLLAYLRTLDV